MGYSYFFIYVMNKFGVGELNKRLFKYFSYESMFEIYE